MTRNIKLDRAEMRILRFLAKGSAEVRSAAAGGSILLDGGERGVIAACDTSLARLDEAALLQRVDKVLSLSKAGRDALNVKVQAPDLPSTPMRNIDSSTMMTADGPETVAVNLAESPLMLLYRRKGKDGQTFIDRREFRAGERLRADYTRGQILPRLGVNWSSIGAQGQSHDRTGGLIELTEAALSARRRVEKAIDAVGPELAGVLIDVCCFLKGMKQVEIERNWPARSAKVVLKSALGALARHYEPPGGDSAGRTARPAILHWGAQDYRPRI